MANYSLFKRTRTATGRARWERVPGAAAYPKSVAIRVFQDRLINSAFGPEPMELRPVKDEPSAMTPANHVLCMPCQQHNHTQCRVRTADGDCACGCRIHQSR
jgi:hypothetical protein